jgi:hypothetical protein
MSVKVSVWMCVTADVANATLTFKKDLNLATRAYTTQEEAQSGQANGLTELFCNDGCCRLSWQHHWMYAPVLPPQPCLLLILHVLSAEAHLVSS